MSFAALASAPSAADKRKGSKPTNENTDKMTLESGEVDSDSSIMKQSMAEYHSTYYQDSDGEVREWEDDQDPDGELRERYFEE